MTSLPYASSVSFLLSQLGAFTARRFAEELAGVGMTPRAFAALSNLVELGPRTQQELADELGMHRNNMVSLVDELEAARWARRVRSVTDRRAFVIEPTAAGRRITERALRVVPALDAELTAGLDARAGTALARALRQLSDNAGLRPGVHPHLSGRR